jgi:DNA-binding SARP family transcriptional activator
VRSADGAVDVAVASEFRVGALRPATVAATTELLVRWGRHLDAIELSIAAGDPEAACRIAAGLPESITETSDPLALLDRLAQLGPRALRDPAIAVVQAATLRALGRHELELEAIDRAAALLDAAAAPELHRRVCAEGGRALLLRGDRDGARNLLTALVGELGDGEHATYARIHECLAECGASSDARLDLVRAEAHYRTAIAAWEACGEGGRARACRRNLALAVLVPLERTDEARVVLSMVAASPDLSPVERCRTRLAEGFALLNAGQLGEADDVLGEASVLAGRHETPRMLASAAWGRAIVASRRRDLAATLQWVAAAENTALTDDDDVLGVPFLCDMATAFGALGRLDLAATYAARASRRSTLFADLVRFTEFVVAARRGEITSAADVAAQIDRTAPTERWRVELVGAHSLARHGELDDARRLLDTAIDGARALGQDLVHLGEGRELAALESLLDGRAASGSVATPTAGLRLVVDRAPVRQLHVTTSPMVVVDNDGSRDVPPGNPEKLIAVVVAAGGSATLDQIGDAFWPDVPRSTSRNRLRNVLLRVRAAVGDLVVRTVNGVRLADDVRSDLLEFERLAADATTAMRVDPDVAGRLARAALDVLHGPVFVSFEYEEWAAAARRATSARCIALLDFLSVESEDAGDLAGAQHYAERALAHDRLADSRYVRLAELLARQDRVAAAITVLDEALDVARSLGVTADGDVRSRRDAFVRRTATAR